MTRPWGEPDGSYMVLANDEAQYSLWPANAAIPEGWKAAHPPSDRQTCLTHVEEQWTDLRPKSLTNTMKRSTA